MNNLLISLLISSSKVKVMSKMSFKGELSYRWSKTSTRLKFFNQSLISSRRSMNTEKNISHQGPAGGDSAELCMWVRKWFVMPGSGLPVQYAPCSCHSEETNRMFWVGLIQSGAPPYSDMITSGPINPNWEKAVTGGFRNKSTNPWVTSHWLHPLIRREVDRVMTTSGNLKSITYELSSAHISPLWPHPLQHSALWSHGSAADRLLDWAKHSQVLGPELSKAHWHWTEF